MCSENLRINSSALKGRLSSRFRYMQIHHRGLDVRMAQRLFDRDYIKSIFEQMCSIGMAKGMHGNVFLNTRLLCCLTHHPLHAFLREPFPVIFAIED